MPSGEPSEVSAAREPTPIEQWSTVALLTRLQNGDKEAADPLYARFKRLLIPWGMTRWKLTFDDAEDFYQETWLAVWRAIPTFDPGRGENGARAWLHRIFANKVEDSRRKQHREREAAEVRPVSFIPTARAAIFRWCWNALSDSERLVILKKAGLPGHPGDELVRAEAHFWRLYEHPDPRAGDEHE